MRRLLLCALSACVLAPLILGVTTTATPSAPSPPSPAVAAPAPAAYPGNKIAWDQIAVDAEEAGLLRFTMAWDGGPKADLSGVTCGAWVNAATAFECAWPIPASTAQASHTIVLTAWKTVAGTRYESGPSDPFTFTYSVPVNPPTPTGCRIKQ